ncbi:MAG: nucleotidyltransferase domain-containing protein [Promethearchaeota archaeon]
MNELKHFPLNKKETMNIQNLIDKISKDPDIIGLIRYGSSVRNNKDYQDVDLCIVSKNKDITAKKQLEYRLFLPEHYDVHFFHNLPLYIQHEVLKEGIVEYIKDYELLFDIYIQSIKADSLYRPRYLRYLEWIKNG